MSSYRNKIREKEDQVEDLKSDISTLNSTLLTLESENVAQKSKISELESTLDGADETIIDFEGKISTQEGEISDLKSRLISFQAIVGELTSQLIPKPGYEKFAAYGFSFDYPKEMEALIQAMDKAYDRFCAVAKEGPYDIVNFGDNVHSDMLPPTLFERYVLPRYRELSALFRESGKFCYPHWDGNVKPLLPYAQSCGFDGIEAITFEPQGDVSIEETKEAMGDVILIDGIPAVFFLPEYLWPV